MKEIEVFHVIAYDCLLLRKQYIFSLYLQVIKVICWGLKMKKVMIALLFGFFGEVNAMEKDLIISDLHTLVSSTLHEEIPFNDLDVLALSAAQKIKNKYVCSKCPATYDNYKSFLSHMARKHEEKGTSKKRTKKQKRRTKVKRQKTDFDDADYQLDDSTEDANDFELPVYKCDAPDCEASYNKIASLSSHKYRNHSTLCNRKTKIKTTKFVCAECIAIDPDNIFYYKNPKSLDTHERTYHYK